MTDAMPPEPHGPIAATLRPKPAQYPKADATGPIAAGMRPKQARRP